MVILPDHLHCIWRLPEGDSDYSKRWRIIKGSFTHWFRSKGNDGRIGLEAKEMMGESGRIDFGNILLETMRILPDILTMFTTIL
jgi:REP element-mobilizing transposase RayT